MATITLPDLPYQMHLVFLPWILVILLALPRFGLAVENQNLPLLGDAASGVISLAQERQLGQAFLRSLRAQVQTIADPLLKDYLEYLIYLLAEHSQLQDKRLSLIILDSRQLNAFAVPGGVVGINLGLFLYAQSRSEFSAILAHELAHISQRHYARSIESSRKSTIRSIAGMLASVILIATTSGEAGMAAMTASQGLAQQAALRNSRSREAEADRIGISTLAEAKLDPRAMAYMFERLNRVNRYAGQRLPEFMLTHPVTQSRISDSYNQTNRYEKLTYPPDLDFQLMRIRVLVMVEQSPEISVRRMQDGLRSDDDTVRTAYQYGLVLALTRASRHDEAQQALMALMDSDPDKIPFIIAQADIFEKNNLRNKAHELLESHLLTTPDNFPLAMRYAALLQVMNEHEKAKEVLETQAKLRPADADVWYILAEAYGLVQDIPNLHKARAEYFMLNGNLDQARKQLEYALPLVRANFQKSERINQRLRDIKALQDEKS